MALIPNNIAILIDDAMDKVLRSGGLPSGSLGQSFSGILNDAINGGTGGPVSSVSYTATAGSGANAFVLNPGAIIDFSSGAGTLTVTGFGGNQILTNGFYSAQNFNTTNFNGSYGLGGSGILFGDASSTVHIRGIVTDGATAVGTVIDNINTLSTSGARILSVRNAGSEKFYVDFSGGASFANNTGIVGAAQYSVGNVGAWFNNSGVPTLEALAANTKLALKGDQSSAGPLVQIGNISGSAITSGNILELYTDNLATKQFSVDFDGKINVPTGGAAAVAGKSSAMSAGTIVVSTTAVTANSVISLTHAGSAVTNAGTLYISAISAGTSFTIHSTNASDTDTVYWWIIN